MLIQIPVDLLEKAYLAQNGEPAWAREDALRVLNWASKNHYFVLGIEIWIPTIPGPTIPTPFIYTFEPRKIQSESEIQWVNRANREADEYIQSFKWDRLDTGCFGIQPYFNITFAREENEEPEKGTP